MSAIMLCAAALRRVWRIVFPPAADHGEALTRAVAEEAAHPGDDVATGARLDEAPDLPPSAAVRGRCPRCAAELGNGHQGHYWSYCSANRAIGNLHYCCPGDCELGGCPDPAGHARLYASRETTWRVPAAQREQDACGWCGGHVPTTGVPR